MSSERSTPSLRLETDSWFRVLAETTSTAIFVYRDKLLYVNHACEELTGFSTAELLEMRLADLAHPDFRELAQERVRVRLRGEAEPAHLEIRIVRKDGEARWMDVYGAAIEIQGEPAGLATAIDVTERRRTEEALRESEQWFRTLAETTATAILVYNRERLLYVNSACADLIGLPVETILSLPPWELAHPDDQQLVRGRIAARLRGERVTSRYEIRVLNHQRGVRWIDFTAGRIEREGGAFGVGTAVDITERKLAEIALAEEKERAQVTLASIGDGVIRTDAAGLVDYLNPVAERLTGWLLAEAAGRPLAEVFQVVDEAGRQPIHDPVARCVREDQVVELPGHSVLIRRGGEEFSIHDSVAPIRDQHGRVIGTVLVFKDVTELRGMEREMSYLARHDALTGLINRREFENRLEIHLRTAREERRIHALFYLDLDEFKVVNDTCGHLAGDEMLKQVSTLLLAQLRLGDTLARLGGDEFGVLLQDTPPERARQLAEAMLAAVRGYRFYWQERIFEVGVSIGLVPIDETSIDLAVVLSAADAACYVAKESGRNRLHQYQQDDTAVAERYGEMQWIHRIHKAFEEKRFCLYRQLIRPLGGEAGGRPFYEIFIRMFDEQGRLVLPGAFVPAAERYHLISSIDRWVVHTALAVLSGSDATFALNLSGHSLGEESFHDHVLGELEQSGIDPRRICFEITETAAVGNLARATRFIATLQALGCRFVLDDFGSGFSSFAYLKNLKVDYLKIDGEFVRDMSTSSTQRALVEAIHQVGHVMGIRTIAESVETPEALELLRQIGVDFVQGFHIGRPEPLE